MDYLTAAEIANKWKVSSRMAAYYCEAGRIEGAVKKGKTWFIPADAPKPLDKRYSRDTIKAKESQAVGDILVDIAESAVYHMKDITGPVNIWGLPVKPCGIMRKSDLSSRKEGSIADIVNLTCLTSPV